MTYFKPGDIVVRRNYNRRVYLVLEVLDVEEEIFELFVLNHEYKNKIGEKFMWSQSDIKYYCVLLNPKRK